MKFALSFLSVAALVVATTFLLGSATPAQADPANPFAGSWSGTFSAVEFEAEGTVDWTISASGAIKGTYLNTTVDVGGTMTGHIDNDGTINLNPNIYGPGPGGEGGNGEHHAGQAYLDGDGNLVAPTTGTWHGGYSVIAILSKN